MFICKLYVSVFVCRLYVSVFVCRLYVSVFVCRLYVNVFVCRLYVSVFVCRLYVSVFVLWVDIFLGVNIVCLLNSKWSDHNKGQTSHKHCKVTLRPYYYAGPAEAE